MKTSKVRRETLYPLQEMTDKTPCPKCGGEIFHCHHVGNFYAPECWWWECLECDFKTEPD